MERRAFRFGVPQLLRTTLIVAAIAWPLVLGTAVWQRVHHHAPIWTSAVYFASATVCHRQPERSFHTSGVQWPVCGRCSGLYLGAAVGGLVALVTRRAWRNQGNAARLLGIAAVPTIITVILEWPRMYDVGNLGRALAAMPVGAAVVLVIAGVVDRLANHGAS
jgi:uncharacterized membrane protein